MLQTSGDFIYFGVGGAWLLETILWVLWSAKFHAVEVKWNFQRQEKSTGPFKIAQWLREMCFFFCFVFFTGLLMIEISTKFHISAWIWLWGLNFSQIHFFGRRITTSQSQRTALPPNHSAPQTKTKQNTSPSHSLDKSCHKSSVNARRCGGGETGQPKKKHRVGWRKKIAGAVAWSASCCVEA